MNDALLTVCVRSEQKGESPLYQREVLGISMPVLTLSSAELFTETMPEIRTDLCLNTDDDELILSVKKSFPQVEVIRREKRLSIGAVPKEDVFRDSVLKMEEKRSKSYDFLIDLDVTAPFRCAKDICGAVNKYLEDPQTDVVMSAVRSRRSPYYNMAVIGEDGHARRAIRSEYTAMQQAPACYEINASIYVVSRDFLIRRMSFDLWQGNVSLYEMRDTGILRAEQETDPAFLELVASYCEKSLPGYRDVLERARLRCGR